MTNRCCVNPWVIVWLCLATLAIVISVRKAVALVASTLFSTIAGNFADRLSARVMLVAGLVLVAAGFPMYLSRESHPSLSILPSAKGAT